MIEKNNIIYIIDGQELKISEPTWWKPTSIEGEANIEDWKKHFKTYFFSGQVNKEIPYNLSHIARDAGDYKLAIEIDLALIEYLKKSDSNLSWNLMYKRLGDSFIEIGDLNLAKEYYRKAIVVKDNKDHSQTYYASKAKEELEKLSLIEDEEKYLSEMSQFRKNLNEKIKLFNSDSNLVERKKQELNGLLWEENTDELNNLQLAFLEILKEDFKSKKPKVLTANLKEQIRKTLYDYHERQETNFEIKPSGIVYPTKINNKWTLHFDGKDYEVVSVDFNRWKVLDVNLSD